MTTCYISNLLKVKSILHVMLKASLRPMNLRLLHKFCSDITEFIEEP